MAKSNADKRLLCLALLCVPLLLVGCSDDEITPVAPGIEPEVINSVDNFQFQVTAMKNYSGTLTYTWSNTGTLAKGNHSSAVTSGTTTLVILDDAGSQVYSEDLAQNGDYFSSAGTNGDWTIRVVLSGATGTLNFRVDKQTP
jgi:hypothetical protein